MTPVARLRASSSLRTACARRTRIAATESPGAPSGSIRAAGLLTAMSAMRMAWARVEAGVARAWRGGAGSGAEGPPRAPRPAEALRAEAVRRPERRRVEVRERARELVAPPAHVGLCATREELHDVIRRGRGRLRSPGGRGRL